MRVDVLREEQRHQPLHGIDHLPLHGIELCNATITRVHNCQQSKTEIRRLQATSRANRTGYTQQQQERIVEQERILQETTARLEEREKMVHDLSELNEIKQLLITRYRDHEDLEADLVDEEHSRSSRDRRR